MWPSAWQIVGAVRKIFLEKTDIYTGNDEPGKLDVGGKGEGGGFQAEEMTFLLSSPHCHHPGPDTFLSCLYHCSHLFPGLPAAL